MTHAIPCVIVPCYWGVFSELRNVSTYILFNVYSLQPASIHLLDDIDRISARAYEGIRSEPHILIDVRSPLEFEICHLPESMNLPLKDLASTEVVQQLKAVITEKCCSGSDFPGKTQFLF
jgi:hypothetical protein